MKNFWSELQRPFFILAPMEDVTDAAFRTLIASKSDPAIPRVIFTEFTSADGLVRANEDGQRKLQKKLQYSDIERPIVAQLFSATPEYMEQAAKLCEELGFDGIDINMGCPADQVVTQRCGAALIKDPPLARELIRAAKRGAPNTPVSVKTRIGYNHDELQTWLPELLAEDPVLVTIHARTRKEMSDVPARWEHVAHAVRIRDSIQNPRGDASGITLIAGNGDLKDLNDAREKAAATGADGAMLGRAMFGNPWIFSGRTDEPTMEEKKQALIEHIELFQKHMSGFANDAVMKKHFKAYVNGWDGAKELRVRLMETETLDEAKKMLID